MSKQSIHAFIIIIFSQLTIFIHISEVFAQTVNIPDPGLRAAVERELSKNAGDTITQDEMSDENFTILFGDDNGISDLTGLEYATSLKYVFLQDNSITDLTPLSNLTGLTNLYLTNNQISDISPLSNISDLHVLLLGYNELTSLENLPDLSSVHALQFQYNQITSIAPLTNHPEFISEYECYLDLEGNPLDKESINNHIPTLFFERRIDVKFPRKYILKFSGDNQTALTNAILQPFVVEVYDFDDNKLSGVGVKFLLISGDGNFTNGSVEWDQAVYYTTTDDNGRASSTLTTGSMTGIYSISVRVDDARSKIFNVTVEAGPSLTYKIESEKPPPIEPSAQQQEPPDDTSETDTTQPETTENEKDTSQQQQEPPDDTSETDTTQPETTENEKDTSQQQELPDDTSETDTTQPETTENEKDTSQQQQQQDANLRLTPDEPPKLLSKLTHPGQIGFSELMFYSRGGLHSVAQWIELYNNSITETVNLRNWQLEIEARDKDNNHRHGVITLENLSIEPKKTVLIVTWNARQQSIDTLRDRVYHFFGLHNDEFEQDRYRNMVLGQVGFFLKLTDPDGAVSDIIGNLDGDSTTKDETKWELPACTTENGARTSLLRKYNIKSDLPRDGTDAANWVRASDRDLNVLTYWGKATDIGNPGHRTVNVTLPVTLSQFRAESTEGDVVINWTTESELENAGFNILRSLSKQGPFVKVNLKLIQGAGTTGERNSYSWIDSTAKPDVEYYYRIEDVSFTGERRTLTTNRLKGLLSAKNRFITRWGKIKTSR